MEKVLKTEKKGKICPVILSGGVGSRLWPLSREKSPKQFIPLLNDKNLLQNTCLRYQNNKFFNQTIIVCNEDHRFQVAESLRAIEISDAEIILEPCAKNTAPAIALAALSIMEKDPEGIMMVSPSDHYIEGFDQVINILTHIQMNNSYLYTFGIRANTPETGYGYIESDQEIDDFAHKVKQFVEKPTKEKAEDYIQSAKYYWNSGLFLFKASTYLEQLKNYELETFQACFESFNKKVKDLDFVRVDKNKFNQSKNISIDYALMEKADKVAVIPLDNIEWSDIGSWTALNNLSKKDQNGNIIQGDVYQVDTKNCYLRSHDRLIATAGITDLVVVETADAILVADSNHTQEIKKLVTKLKKDKRQEINKHRRHYAPWGHSEQIAKGDNFIVNKLYFKANAKSSLQMHYHRNEYFTVLSGAAKIIVDKKEYLLSEGMSVNITPLQKHQVIAIGHLPVELLEIQSGSYLSDEDIVRFEEVY